jgi:6-phosphogluconolactonase
MKAVRGAALIREDESLASETAADLFVCAALRSVRESGVFYVAIPGGHSPRGVFARLAEPGWSQHVPWDKVHVFFTDERCVQPDDQDSNYRLANDLLLSKVPIPQANVHRFQSELPPDEAAAKYEAEITRVMGRTPVFDLIVLGMGANTHTASLFPDSPALDETTRLAVANYVEELHSYRLTLTIPILCSARSVMILAFGESKAEAVRTALQGDIDVRSHPVQAIRPPNARLLWVLDQPAAALL